ncbi:hypothetical protein GCM10025867_36580 [Frondihabitans sucicola]|uniref:Solute-binding protein family 5 domain-containing protein n=1 Tax=Frondihabitans sucicola TaxID=1268041 RepID=A0ABN6Y263_9MICO|nr:hypothetical protein GCM10025867_36580 [Frondihabitans sucicola]
MKKFIAGVGIALAVALVLTGCSAGSTKAGSDTATTAVQKGGSITVGIDDWCGAYDKQQTSGCTFSNMQVTDNLVDQDPKTGKVVPWLATSWKISKDLKQYSFALRTGVTFSNGEKFDATAVKENFDSIIQLGKQGNAFQSSAYLQGYTGTRVVDASHLVVTFSTPKAGFLQALTEAPLGIVSPTTTRRPRPSATTASSAPVRSSSSRWCRIRRSSWSAEPVTTGDRPSAAIRARRISRRSPSS